MVKPELQDTADTQDYLLTPLLTLTCPDPGVEGLFPTVAGWDVEDEQVE